MARNKHLINVHTSTGTTAPTGASLYLGEIAVQHTPDEPAMWIKVGSAETSTEYEKFIGETEILELISGGTDIAPLSAALISLSAGVKKNEYVAAAAINYLNDRINELSGNTGAGAEPLSAAVISLSGAVVAISGNTGPDVTPLSGAVVNLSGAAVSNSQKINSLSASVVTITGQVQTVSASVEALETEIADTLTGVSMNGTAVTVTNRVAELTSSTIYAGAQQPSQSLGNNGDVYLQTDSVVLYETDGTTGLLGINSTAASLSNSWQLEDMDFTPYRYIKCYFKASTGVNLTAYTPAVVVTVPLEDASLGTTAYIGGTMCVLPFNKNREYTVSCAVDSTKTKFQVIHQDTLWDISSSDANSDGRYLYKIEGYI